MHNNVWLVCKVLLDFRLLKINTFKKTSLPHGNGLTPFELCATDRPCDHNWFCIFCDESMCCSWMIVHPLWTFSFFLDDSCFCMPPTKCDTAPVLYSYSDSYYSNSVFMPDNPRWVCFFPAAMMLILCTIHLPVVVKHPPIITACFAFPASRYVSCLPSLSKSKTKPVQTVSFSFSY